MRTKQQNGEYIGSWAAYGYRKCADDRHRIEPDEETAPVVRDIFQWRLEGMSYVRIVRRLNERDIPSPARYHYLKGEAKCERYANSKWAVMVVKKMLTNEVYLGHMVQGRKRSGFCEGQKQRLLPKEEWTVVRNTHAPLIDEETFLAVQKMEQECHDAYYAKLGKHDALGPTPNILRGLIFCADCKRPLVRYKNVINKGTKMYYVYICPTHADDPNACPKKYLYETVLLEVLWDTLRREIELAVNFEELVRKYGRSKESINRERAIEQELSTARQALNRAERLYNSLYENYIDHLMDEWEYAEMKRRYQSDIDSAKERIASAEQERQMLNRQTALNPWLTSFGRYREETALTEEMAHELIERVEVDGENTVSITLRYRDEYDALKHLLDGAESAVSA